jgi:dihydroorotate dehydrogenase electron transfer subunit
MSAVSTSNESVSCRQRHDGVVVSNRNVCREHFELTVRVLPGERGSFGPTAPGQFIQIGCRPPIDVMDVDSLYGEEIEITEGTWPSLKQPEMTERLALLRRPFSLSGRWDDEQGTCIQIVQRVVGTGTQWLSQLKAGDKVDLIGPLGNTFTLPEDRKLGLLVGGGVGLPPMFYLANAMAKAGWDAIGFVGAMTTDLLAVNWVDGVAPNGDGKPVQSVQQFAQYGFDAVVTTDDGSTGLKGRITDGLIKTIQSLSDEQKKQAVIYTCGPHVMMHAVAKLAEQFGIPCQACLEQTMACGMGTCQSCIVKIEDDNNPHGTLESGRNWRYKLTCTDGPVFDSTDVIW